MPEDGHATAALVLAAFLFGSTFLVVQDATEQASVMAFLAVRFLFGAALLWPLARRRPPSHHEIRHGLAGGQLPAGRVRPADGRPAVHDQLDVGVHHLPARGVRPGDHVAARSVVAGEVGDRRCRPRGRRSAPPVGRRRRLRPRRAADPRVRAGVRACTSWCSAGPPIARPHPPDVLAAADRRRWPAWSPASSPAATDSAEPSGWPRRSAASGPPPIAFLCMVWAQRVVSEARAAIILLLEPVFAAFIGYLVGRASRDRAEWSGRCSSSARCSSPNWRPAAGPTPRYLTALVNARHAGDSPEPAGAGRAPRGFRRWLIRRRHGRPSPRGTGGSCPGLFTVEESAARVGHYKWIEMRLFEVLGGWVATVPELDVKMRLGTHTYHHAWHAELWHKRLPELGR